MARYHAILQETIDIHGGRVASFMGDGMMALFGIPEIAEDDALRAVGAWLDIQRRFAAFAAEVLTALPIWTATPSSRSWPDWSAPPRRARWKRRSGPSVA